MTTRDDIVREAKAWMSTPWRHQARIKGVATDCVGLIAGVALELGLAGWREWAADPRFRGYGRTPDPDLLREGCARLLDGIAIHDARPGDILAYSFEHDPQHFAIVSAIDPGRIIHAYAQRRRVVENGMMLSGARITSAWAYRGVS